MYPIPTSAPIAVVQGWQGGSFNFPSLYFTLPLSGPTGHTSTVAMLDTGSFALLIDQSVADKMGLPNLGPITIRGVGGNTMAHWSLVSFTLGTHAYDNQWCVVEPDIGVTLFGMQWFRDEHIHTLDLNLDTNQWAVW